jgi:hypothetical protein
MVSVMKLDCQEHWALTMVSSIGPHQGQGWTKFIKWGQIEGLKDMNRVVTLVKIW